MKSKTLVFGLGTGLIIAVFLSLHLQDQLMAGFEFLLDLMEKREHLRNFVLSLGPYGPVGFILLQILQVILSPIPGEATGFLGGFIFGKWLGLVYSTIGLSLGSFLAFFISRQFRKIVAPWLRKSDLYWKFEGLLERQGIFVCFFLYVFPGFPKDFLCYLLGLTRMPWQVFLFISSVGRIPGTLMLSWQGAEIYEGNLTGFLLLLLFSAVVAGPAWYYRDEIYEWIEKKTTENNS
ncbi:MAG: TVP38/TMEM64 family protein [Thermodesulfatator sp.]|nr:MAG: TVP38/TMEM64 family protein [Thermodesulfatator sp.]